MRGENFPVASRLLGSQLRRDLRAVYDVVRTVDYLGDEAPGDRRALLDAFDAELGRLWQGDTAAVPALANLAPTVRRHELDISPFRSLIEANRRDQTVSHYETWSDLRGYCALSADPVGRIVLQILHADTPEHRRYADGVCTALQVIEHCQDVGEDRANGRVYLPQEDLDRYGVELGDLDAMTTAANLRAVIRLETIRASRLLHRHGPPLVRGLRGYGRVAVAGFVAGGLATVDALQRADFDILARDVVPPRRAALRHLARLLSGQRT
jgi:squalene synthase HpnC